MADVLQQQWRYQYRWDSCIVMQWVQWCVRYADDEKNRCGTWLYVFASGSLALAPLGVAILYQAVVCLLGRLSACVSKLTLCVFIICACV